MSALDPKPAKAQGISPADYQCVREFLRAQIGYELGEGKEYLVENRLAPIAASYDLAQISLLIDLLRRSSNPPLRQAIVEAMAINETFFFRAPRIFDTLSKVILPNLIQARASTRKLRIWCAACATGQEPYSLAMTFADHLPQLASWRIEILATDVSERALEQARQGLYNQFEVQRGLPIQSLLKHFAKEGPSWRISNALRSRVDFRKHNLLDSFLLLAPPFDLIFLRNVLIYFDIAAKSVLFGRLRQAIAPDGYLVLGETESVLGLTDQFILPDVHRDFFRPA
jgi:chemotaxis protein methyltransferase CheR